jgi:hypothetical protein
MKSIPKEFQWFVLYHEIGHHKLGHTLFDKEVKDEELYANLYAVEYLYLYHGFREKEFDIIFSRLRGHIKDKKEEEKFFGIIAKRGYASVKFQWTVNYAIPIF